MNTTELKALAEKATPGPWITEDWASTDNDGAINVCGTSVTAPQALCGIFTVALEGDELSDVEFIASANPAAILELITKLEDAQAQMERQKDEWLSWEAKRRDLEKDAERYRFAADPQSDGYAVCEWNDGDWIPINTEDLDAAIKEQT